MVVCFKRTHHTQMIKIVENSKHLYEGFEKYFDL